MIQGGNRGLAALPMYDRPEVAEETDALWAAIRQEVRAEGLDAPDRLTRQRPERLLWAAPELVVGQTCGLPYVSALHERVGLLGAPAYALEDCPPGFYRSAVIVRHDCAAEDLAGMAGTRPAINARDSQSGYGALMYAAAPLAVERKFYGPAVITGSHRSSVDAVAGGRADIAAIDAVTWELCQRYDRAAGDVRVLCWTEPTPGLPLITGHRRQQARIQAAVERAFGSLDAHIRRALCVIGFRRFVPSDYQVIRDRLAAAHNAHRLPGPLY